VSKVEYVFRHGKRIEVEVLDPPKSRQLRKVTSAAFAKTYLSEAAARAKALNEPLVFIMPLLDHLAWKTKGATFPLSNELLARYGVSRKVKYRALRRLREAGIVDIQNSPGRAMIVTLLVPTKKDVAK
jgi:DNA-binding transcriptional ArsR family regulator